RRADRSVQPGSAVMVAVPPAMAVMSMTVSVAMGPVVMVPFMDDDGGRRAVGAVDRITIHRRARMIVIDPRRRPVVVMMHMLLVPGRARARRRADRATHDGPVAPAEGLAEQRTGAGADHRADDGVRGLRRGGHREATRDQGNRDDSTDAHGPSPLLGLHAWTIAAPERKLRRTILTA